MAMFREYKLVLMTQKLPKRTIMTVYHCTNSHKPSQQSVFVPS